MQRKFVWLILSFLIVLALVLVSCRPAAVEEEEGKVITGKVTEEKEVVTKEKEKAEVPVPKEEKGPQYGGTLRPISNVTAIEPMSWDPIDNRWKVNYDAGFYMEQLAVGDLSKGPRGTGEFGFTTYFGIPDDCLTGELAESWEQPDPLTLIYHLRKGIRWQDKPGVMTAREFVADDVVFCWNRLLSEESQGRSFFTFVESVTAPDKYTVVFKISESNPDIMMVFGYQYYTLMYPPELVKAGIDDWKNAVGTGPFMLEDYVRGSSQTYVRNPNYWGTTVIDGKEYRLPFVDKVELAMIPDESTRLAALRTGKIDVLELTSWKYKDTLEQTTPELIRTRFLLTATVFVAMRMDEPPFDDIRVRRALSLAVDQQGMIDGIYGGEGEVLNYPMHMVWPESVYTPLEKLPESAREQFEYKPEKAKQLLAEAGYPSGFNTELIVYSAFGEQASMVASYWEDIGVNCELKTVDYATWTGIWYGATHRQTILVGTGAITPYWIMDKYAWQRKNEALQNVNEPRFNDSHFNELVWKAGDTLDPDERAAILKEANVYLLEQVPFVMLGGSYNYHYKWPWVKNLYNEINVGCYRPQPIYARVWIDQDLKYKMIGQR